MNELHKGNDIQGLRDEDLAAIHQVLHALLVNVITPEIHNRVTFEKSVQKEIEQITNLPINSPIKKLMEALMPQQKSIIPFNSKGPKKDSNDGTIVDHGNLGDLQYEVYSRNVIHIFDKNLMFHKDIAAFEDEIGKLDFAAMAPGDSHTVKGAGDTDNLIFRCDEDGIKVELARKGFDVVEKLKSVLRKNKK
jgi:hypothetical protein